MLRLCSHRSKWSGSHGSRDYATTSSTPSPEEARFKTLKVRMREAAVQPNADKLAELRQSALYHEIYEWGRRQAQTAARRSSTDRTDNSARHAAAVQTICYTLDAYLNFSRHYDLPPASSPKHSNDKDGEQAFLKHIRPHHHHRLMTHFHESLKTNTEERRAAILSALDARLLDKLCNTGVATRTELQGWKSTTDPRQALTEAELLAVVDYLNSATGTFNVVNGAAIASAYYGEHSLSSRITVFSSALNSAIAKLCDHPYFARRDIVCYKGIRLGAMDSPFRLAALNDACTKQGMIVFPNVLSASCDPEESYARKKYEQGYTLECKITMQRGFYADPFHDPKTMGEQEILGPANQRFRVTGKSSFTIFDWSGETPAEVDVDRYTMVAADL